MIGKRETAVLARTFVVVIFLINLFILRTTNNKLNTRKKVTKVKGKNTHTQKQRKHQLRGEQQAF